MLRAVIFDFDGIIVDTEPLHHRAFGMLLGPLGLSISWEEYRRDFMGLDDRGAIELAHSRAGQTLEASQLQALVEKKAAIFQSLVATTPPNPFPGAVELIRSLAGRVPLALCSGALRSDIAPIFRALALDKAFDVMVTAEDVHRSKPDPACYRLAVARLAHILLPGLLPQQVIAIEDTPAGIQAAKGAGVAVLAVTNSYDRESLHLADFVCDSLAEVTTEKLAAWMAAKS